MQPGNITSISRAGEAVLEKMRPLLIDLSPAERIDVLRKLTDEASAALLQDQRQIGRPLYHDGGAALPARDIHDIY